MKIDYERTDLIITEFDNEDVISTSGTQQISPPKRELENAYRSFDKFNASGPWF